MIRLTISDFGSRMDETRLKMSGEPHFSIKTNGIPLGLAVLAIAQMGIHLVFFLHVTTGPDNANNVLADYQARPSMGRSLNQERRTRP